MTAQDMLNYVVASAQFVDTCHQKLQKQASELEQLKSEKAELTKKLEALPKEASAPAPAPEAIVFDETKLMKAANDMHTIHGKPSSVSPEQIAEYWRKNPNTLLDTFCKLASAQMEHSVNGEHIGSARKETLHQKKAAAVAGFGEDAATAALWAKYSK